MVTGNARPAFLPVTAENLNSFNSKPHMAETLSYPADAPALPSQNRCDIAQKILLAQQRRLGIVTAQFPRLRDS